MQLHILYTLPHSERITKQHIMCVYIYIYIYIHSYFTDIGATSILNEENSIPCHCWCYKHVGHQICLIKMPKLNVWFVVLHFMSNTLQNAFEVCEYLVGRLARYIASFLNIQCTQCALCFFWVCMYIFRKLHNIYMSIS
jgi:hypothetical protein